MNEETISYADRIHSGETDALFEYIENRRPQLIAFINRNMGDRLRTKIEPEDVLQEAALSCLKSFGEIDFSKIDMFSWICQQCQRRIVDSHRHFFAAKKRDAAKEIALSGGSGGEEGDLGFEGLIAASITTPSAAFSKQQKEFQMQHWIAGVSEDAQTVLKLRFVDGLATKEIAKKMEKSDAAVRVLLTRTVKKLKDAVGLDYLS